METHFFTDKCEEHGWVTVNNRTPDNLIINTGSRKPADQVEPQLLPKVVIAQKGPFPFLLFWTRPNIHLLNILM